LIEWKVRVRVRRALTDWPSYWRSVGKDFVRCAQLEDTLARWTPLREREREREKERERERESKKNKTESERLKKLKGTGNILSFSLPPSTSRRCPVKRLCLPESGCVFEVLSHCALFVPITLHSPHQNPFVSLAKHKVNLWETASETQTETLSHFLSLSFSLSFSLSISLSVSLLLLACHLASGMSKYAAVSWALMYSLV
jgi:hypothetical protein